MSVSGLNPSDRARGQWVIPPRRSLTTQLATACETHQVVLVTGMRGAGKTSYTHAAAQLFVEASEGRTVVVASQLSKRALISLLPTLRDALLIIERPTSFPHELLAQLSEAINENNVTVVIEAVSKEAITPEMQDFARSAQRQSLHIPALDRHEFRALLAEYLGGALPNRMADTLWQMTGGNQELAQITISELVRRGDLAPGKYAWSWSGPFELPSEVIQHVERQHEELEPDQGRFLMRLSLLGSVPLGQVNEFISDESLSFLEASGFIAHAVRPDGGAVVQLASQLCGLVLARNARPSELREVFASVPAPTRGKEDARAMIAWVVLAMRLGHPLTTDQITLGNDSAFTLMTWEMIDQFVDLKIPANKTPEELKALLRAEPAPERAKLLFIVLQRGLAHFFNAAHDQSMQDLRLVRELFDEAPTELGVLDTWLTALELLNLRVFPETGKTSERLLREIERASTTGQTAALERYQFKLFSQANFGAADLAPLEDLLEAVQAGLGKSGAAIEAVPTLLVRLANAGRLREFEAMLGKTVSLREMRITNLPENANTFAFGEVVFKGSWGNLMLGQTAGMKTLRSLNLAELFLDPVAAQLLDGVAHSLEGRWEQALTEYRGALQFLEVCDHLRTKKHTLSAYIQALAETGRHSEALQAIAEYERLDWGSRALLEADGWLRVIGAKYALSLPEFAAELESYLDFFELHEQWFHVMKAAHLGAVVSNGATRDRYAERMRAAAAYVDTELALRWESDLDAVISNDVTSMAHARAALVRVGGWVPARHKPLSFSRRQKEIADLVMRGHSNKEIAEKLFLSVRTVESHVSAILAKVDLTDRRRLAERLVSLR